MLPSVSTTAQMLLVAFVNLWHHCPVSCPILIGVKNVCQSIACTVCCCPSFITCVQINEKFMATDSHCSTAVVVLPVISDRLYTCIKSLHAVPCASAAAACNCQGSRLHQLRGHPQHRCQTRWELGPHASSSSDWHINAQCLHVRHEGDFPPHGDGELLRKRFLASS